MTEHILVLVPTQSRWVTESIARFFAQATHKTYDPSHPYKYTVSTLPEVRGFAIMRNIAAAQLLASPCDRLWMIDNDTILPADIFELPAINGDIVTLPYPFVGTMTPAICNYKDLDDFDAGMEELVVGKGGVADVNGTGMGCTLIRRKVLEDPAMRYPTIYETPDGKVRDLKDESQEVAPIFRYHMKPNGQTMQGEDYDFCIRAKKLGYSIKVRMTSICGHLKTIDLNDAFQRTLLAVNQPRADTKMYAL